MIRRGLVVVLILCASLAVAAPAHACDIFDILCKPDTTGLDVYGQEELHRMAQEQAKQIKTNASHYEYKTIDACAPGGVLFRTEDCLTNKITTMCAPTEGPMVEILRRLVKPDGTVQEDWAALALTCRGNDVPGAAKRPTMAMIRDAMHHTPWAKATIGFQPKGYKTLVNLPNFYAANWSVAGFGPGEVDTVDPATMFGHQVRIRPKLLSFTYHFGDGESVGPTTSTGGVYPNGDVRHTYRKAGTYSSNVTVVWGADFSVDGSPWLEIPDTVSVDEPAQPIAVFTATNRLVR